MKTIHKDFWGRCTSSSQGAEAKVHAKSIELNYKILNKYRITTHYTATEFKKQSEIRWEATIDARGGGGGRQGIKIDFTKHAPMGQEEDELAMHWSVIPGVNELVMVDKYTDDDNTTLVIFVLAAILLLVILFNK